MNKKELEIREQQIIHQIVKQKKEQSIKRRKEI